MPALANPFSVTDFCSLFGEDFQMPNDQSDSSYLSILDIWAVEEGIMHVLYACASQVNCVLGIQCSSFNDVHYLLCFLIHGSSRHFMYFIYFTAPALQKTSGELCGDLVSFTAYASTVARLSIVNQNCFWSILLLNLLQRINVIVFKIFVTVDLQLSRNAMCEQTQYNLVVLIDLQFSRSNVEFFRYQNIFIRVGCTFLSPRNQ